MSPFSKKDIKWLNREISRTKDMVCKYSTLTKNQSFEVSSKLLRLYDALIEKKKPSAYQFALDLELKKLYNYYDKYKLYKEKLNLLDNEVRSRDGTN